MKSGAAGVVNREYDLRIPHPTTACQVDQRSQAGNAQAELDTSKGK
jgi:hypothetical protein